MRQRHFLSCHRNPQNKSCCFKGTDVSLNAWSYCLCIGLEIYTLLFYLGQLNFWPLIYLFISNIPLRCYLPWLDHIRSFPITMLPLVNYNKEQWKVCKEINLMIGTFPLHRLIKRELPIFNFLGYKKGIQMLKKGSLGDPGPLRETLFGIVWKCDCKVKVWVPRPLHRKTRVLLRSYRLNHALLPTMAYLQKVNSNS